MGLPFPPPLLPCPTAPPAPQPPIRAFTIINRWKSPFGTWPACPRRYKTRVPRATTCNLPQACSSSGRYRFPIRSLSLFLSGFPISAQERYSASNSEIIMIGRFASVGNFDLRRDYRKWIGASECFEYFGVIGKG